MYPVGTGGANSCGAAAEEVEESSSARGPSRDQIGSALRRALLAAARFRDKAQLRGQLDGVGQEFARLTRNDRPDLAGRDAETVGPAPGRGFPCCHTLFFRYLESCNALFFLLAASAPRRVASPPFFRATSR
jgi:hypothetical protein